jgi:hypothetical protein
MPFCQEPTKQAIVNGDTRSVSPFIMRRLKQGGVGVSQASLRLCKLSSAQVTRWLTHAAQLFSNTLSFSLRILWLPQDQLLQW